jgi:hypothetical protein
MPDADAELVSIPRDVAIIAFEALRRVTDRQLGVGMNVVERAQWEVAQALGLDDHDAPATEKGDR